MNRRAHEKNPRSDSGGVRLRLRENSRPIPGAGSRWAEGDPGAKRTEDFAHPDSADDLARDTPEHAHPDHSRPRGNRPDGHPRGFAGSAAFPGQSASLTGEVM